MLGASEAARALDADRPRPLAHRDRNRGSAEPDVGHERTVHRGIEVGVVEQAGEEVRGALAGGEMVFDHRREHPLRVPHVDQVHVAAPEDGHQQRGDHADAVTHGRAGEHVDRVGVFGRRELTRLDRGQLADLGVDRAVHVHDTLRIRRRAARVRDERGSRRVDGDRRVDAAVLDEVGERERAGRGAVSDDGDPLEVVDVALGPDRVEIGEEVLVTELVRGHERLHPRAPEDVADLLRAVEVHDRHDDRAEVRDRVERGRGLDPVRELERDRVAGPDAAGAQAGGDPARELVDLAERAAVRSALGTHGERVIGNRAQARSRGCRRASRRSRSRRARSCGHGRHPARAAASRRACVLSSWSHPRAFPCSVYPR